MSFLKQEPPKPTPALRNLVPMRESVPMARATSSMSAPVASQKLESALMDETRWAREGVGGELGHLGGPDLGGEYSLAEDPVGVDLGEERSGGGVAADEDAVGILKVGDGGTLGEELGVGENVEGLAGAGSVEDLADTLGGADGEGGFSTTRVWSRAALAMRRVQDSTKRRSEALPAPSPSVLVGVLTEMKTQSAAAMAGSMSVEKKRLRPRAQRTTASRPGS
jgi:hypothetical protein